MGQERTNQKNSGPDRVAKPFNASIKEAGRVSGQLGLQIKFCTKILYYISEVFQGQNQSEILW